MINVVSVDWDFFFPDLLWYDWGHHESGLFYEVIWSTRIAARHLKTGAYALDEILPRESDMHGFWTKVIDRSYKPAYVVIVESHADIFNVLKQLGGCEVWNFDQHHDCGYFGADKKPAKWKSPKDCGSWAYDLQRRGAMGKYHLVYPEWRRQSPETENPDKLAAVLGKKGDVRYGLEGFRPVPADIIFLCRSYAWTPTWSDPDWFGFSATARFMAGPNTELIEGKTVRGMRHPTMAEAKAELPKLREFYEKTAFGAAVPTAMGSR